MDDSTRLHWVLEHGSCYGWQRVYSKHKMTGEQEVKIVGDLIRDREQLDEFIMLWNTLSPEERVK